MSIDDLVERANNRSNEVTSIRSETNSLDRIKDEKTNSEFRQNLSYGWELFKAYFSSAVGYGLAGYDALLSGGAFALGAAIIKRIRKKKISIKELLQEYTTGSILGGLGSKMYSTLGSLIPGVDLVSKLKRAAAVIGPGNMLFNAAYLPLNKLVKNKYNPKEIAKDFKENYWNLNKQTWKYLSLPLGLTVNGYLGGYPGMVAVDAGFRVLAEGRKKK